MLVRVQEFLADGNKNRRIPFPASRDKQKQTKQQEAEQDEADARADLRDILSRDEIKRNAFRIQKAKEREKLEVPCLLSVSEHAQREFETCRPAVTLHFSPFIFPFIVPSTLLVEALKQCRPTVA